MHTSRREASNMWPHLHIAPWMFQEHRILVDPACLGSSKDSAGARCLYGGLIKDIDAQRGCVFHLSQKEGNGIARNKERA